MNIDYDAYTNMDEKELEKIVSHIKNIQHLREKNILQAFEESNLSKLKAALEHNREMRISEKAWEMLDFHDLDESKLDFFLFVIKTPSFDKRNDKFNHIEEGVSCALYNKNLFDFFIKEKEFSSVLEDVIKKDGIHGGIPVELVKEFFIHKLLEPTEECLNIVIERGCTNYLNYFLDNNIFELTEVHYRKLYLQHFKHIDEEFFVRLKGLYPDYLKISLDELLSYDPYFNNPYDTDETYDNAKKYDSYKQFVKIDEERFFTILREHEFGEDSVRQLMSCFNNMAPSHNDKFRSFINLLAEIRPQYLEVVKDCAKTMTSGHFKKHFATVLDYINLQTDLERKDDSLEKKLKI